CLVGGYMLLHRLLLVSLSILFTPPAISEPTPVELRFLGWGYLPPFEENFKKIAAEHNLDVTITMVKPVIEVADDVFNALRADAADVLLPGSHFFGDFNARLFKLLHPIDVNRIPNYQYLQPALSQAKFDTYQEKKYSVPQTAAVMRLIYNADKVSTAPTSFLVLSDPENKGKVATSAIAENSLIPLLLGLGYTAYEAQDYHHFRLSVPQLQTLATQLVSNKQYYWQQVNDVEKMQDISYSTSWGIEVSEARASGQNWQFSEAKGIQALDTLVIAKKLTNQPDKLKAAYLLINYLISEEYQTAFVHAAPFIYPSNTQVAQHLTEEELELSRANDPYYFNEANMLRYRDKRTNNTYLRIWDKAKKENKE
ncbi:extracellular solute-binding protein, partial [Vibrio sp. Of7-15]|uniref:ABC transporter substrate-binding protein n=1 Tax=Vibrio sp. Of7-15 TaxID=2724879 RepID=UPI001EF24139